MGPFYHNDGSFYPRSPGKGGGFGSGFRRLWLRIKMNVRGCRNGFLILITSHSHVAIPILNATHSHSHQFFFRIKLLVRSHARNTLHGNSQFKRQPPVKRDTHGTAFNHVITTLNHLIKWIKSGVNSGVSSGVNSGVNFGVNYVN